MDRITLHPIVHDPRNPRTDIAYIVNSPSYSDALVLFNDNFENRNDICRGANTAEIRPRTFDVPCRVVGIPTGWRPGDGGFQCLTESEKNAIAAAFERINAALHANSALRRVVYFSSATDLKQLGFAMFRPAPSVIAFINVRLHNIPTRFAQGMPVSILALDMWEDMINSRREGRPRILDKRRFRSWQMEGIRHPKDAESTNMIGVRQ